MNQEQEANNEDTDQVVDVAQLVECLPNMHNALDSVLSTHKSLTVTSQSEGRKQEIQGHPVSLMLAWPETVAQKKKDISCFWL